MGDVLSVMGKIVDMWVESDGSHSEAVRNTENLLIYSEKSKDGLYLANGQPYASYVESKGFEVIMTNGILYAGRQIEKNYRYGRHYFKCRQ